MSWLNSSSSSSKPFPIKMGWDIGHNWKLRRLHGEFDKNLWAADLLSALWVCNKFLAQEAMEDCLWNWLCQWKGRNDYLLCLCSLSSCSQRAFLVDWTKWVLKMINLLYGLIFIFQVIIQRAKWKTSLYLWVHFVIYKNMQFYLSDYYSTFWSYLLCFFSHSDFPDLSSTSWLDKIKQTVHNVLSSFNFFKTPVDLSGKKKKTSALAR